jgi:hypothetical protein
MLMTTIGDGINTMGSVNAVGFYGSELGVGTVNAGHLTIAGESTYDSSTGTTWTSEMGVDYYAGIHQKKTDALGSSLESLLDPSVLKVGWNNDDYAMGGSYGVEITPFELNVRHYWDSLGGSVGAYTQITPSEVNTSTIHAQDVNVNVLNASQVVTTPKWQSVPDFVFEPGYEPRSLSEVETFVKENHHLPDVPSAHQIAENGLDLTEMNLKLLKTVEEMTLHLISLEKELAGQKARTEEFEQRIGLLQAQDRLR